MTPTIDELARRYSELEKRLHQHIGAQSNHICAACPNKCCHARYCFGVAESPWLQKVVALDGVELPEGELVEGDINFLTHTGCGLAAGRPMECTWYICDSLSVSIPDPLKRYIYQVLSNILGYIVRKVKADYDLTEVDDLDSLTKRQREKIAERIDTSHRCIDICAELLEKRRESLPVDDIADKMLFLARTFPYAASSVRFPGEQPSLSAAGRKKLAAAEH